MAVLYGNDAFSLLVLTTKKRYSNFLKKVLVFQKICFKVKKYWNRSKFPQFVTKTCRSLKQRAIFKIPSTIFRRIYALSVGFKVKPLGKNIFQCQDRNQPKFCRKTFWKEQPFIFTVYLINHIFQTSVLFNTW